MHVLIPHRRSQGLLANQTQVLTGIAAWWAQRNGAHSETREHEGLQATLRPDYTKQKVCVRSRESKVPQMHFPSWP